MNIRQNLRLAIQSLTTIPILGRFVKISAAVWRGPQTRIVMQGVQISLNDTQASLGALTIKFNEISNGYGIAIRGLESALKRHEALLYTMKTLAEKNACLEEEGKSSLEKIKWLSVDNDNLRHRIEFIRKEVMHELRKELQVVNSRGAGSVKVNEPLFINLEKINQPGPKKLNLGCGHIPKEGFINVDSRNLPGVDLVSDVTSLPFDKESIDTIYAAHLVEHFSERSLKDLILPNWFNLLNTGGHIILIVPDAQAMITAYTSGEFSFEELREVIFGGQEYDGDFHFTMLAPGNAVELLRQAGFDSIVVVAAGRKNGGCYEFEIHAKKPQITQ